VSVKPQHEAIVQAGKAMNAEEHLAELRATIQNWHEEFHALNRQKLDLEDNIALIINYGKTLKAISPLLTERGVSLGETARAIVLSGYTDEALQALAERLKKEVDPLCEFIEHDIARDTVAAIVVHPAGKGNDVSELLKSEGIQSLESPDKDVTGSALTDVLSKVDQKVAVLKSDREVILSKIDASSEKHGANIAACNQIINDRSAQVHVRDHFAQSEMVGVVHGWTPSTQYDTLAATLKKDFGDRVAIDRLSQEEVEASTVPTLLKNAKAFQPFELILKLMKPPTYGSIDPTSLIAISFIIFYGFILGDIGYGLTLLTIAYLTKSKWGHIAPVKDAVTILQCMGISACVFGALYFEMFGDVLERWFPSWHYFFHRGLEPEILLIIAITFGAIHIPLSLILAVRENFKHGHTKHGQEKLGLLLGLFSIICGAATVGGFFPAAVGYGLTAILFAAAMYFMAIGAGAMALMGPIEFIGLASNILSYARLMALGIAGIAFANIANQLPDSMGFIGYFAAAGVHAFNIALGIFSPTIHSLRLNFVEFLPKFYEPKGRTYKPFRKEMVW
jgi:V/A-type H+-transporting ATPase subunit I